MKLIGVSEQFLVLLGRENNDQIHRHYDIQLQIPTSSMIINGKRTTDQVLIDSNVKHITSFADGDMLSFLIHPESRIGQNIRRHYFKSDRIATAHLSGLVEQIKVIYESMTDLNRLKRVTHTILDRFIIDPSDLQQLDDRVTDMLNCIHSADLAHLQLADVLNSVHLSKSRLTHLFKNEMKISVMRYMTWTRLFRAAQSLVFSNASITATAHQFGFADASHFSRVFKESFGYCPKRLVQEKKTTVSFMF
ncbi:helix-turn-helix transcriptional regulator [Paenibacillus sp. ACRRX]|uniref:AraC family transcriptional regulator n=1 Tax=Paenibacillus sp. ACRRX TaxID=2918206 RepID=UPI001EF64951|nr:AraC family transcriptional regulator [Paenibacillus sp. ACRRX]MCG7410168.1 helix-turn-helix transcriptional regulator [Paenibacillus sp. ACRRX]